MKKNIVILIYMTLECNLRCYYCVVNFKKEFISFQTIDDIISFIKKNRNSFGKVSIEFFGGEPLLVFNKIRYFVKNTLEFDLEYKITTNGDLINKEIIFFFNNYFSSIYISFNEFSNKKLLNFYKIFNLIDSKFLNKYSITFLYHPEKCYKTHIKFLNILINFGYINFNILPIYMYKNYSLDEFKNLKIFLEYTKKLYKRVNFEYFYFIEEKQDLEFSIIPNGICTLDSGETIYDLDKNRNLSLGYIKNLDHKYLIKEINNFDVSKYIKHFLDKKKVSQDYDNFMKVSNLLKNGNFNK